MATKIQDARDYAGVLSNGTAITPANSGPTGSDPVDDVTAQSGSTVTFDSAGPYISIHGAAGGVCRLGRTDLGAADEFFAVLEGYGISAITSGPRLIDYRTSGDVGVARLETDTNRRVYLYAGSTQVANSGVSEQIPTAAGWRLEMTGKITGGLLRAALYVQSDGKSLTALWDSGALSSQPMGSTGVSWARFGKPNTTPSADYKIRNFLTGTTYGLYGPYYDNPSVGTPPRLDGSRYTGYVTTDPAGLSVTVVSGDVISGPIVNGDLIVTGGYGLFPVQSEEVVIDWTVQDSNGRQTVNRQTYAPNSGGGGTVGGISMWTSGGYVSI